MGAKMKAVVLLLKPRVAFRVPALPVPAGWYERFEVEVPFGTDRDEMFELGNDGRRFACAGVLSGLPRSISVGDIVVLFDGCVDDPEDFSASLCLPAGWLDVEKRVCAPFEGIDLIADCFCAVEEPEPFDPRDADWPCGRDESEVV